MTVLIRYCIKNHNQKLSGCPVCHQIILDIDVAFLLLFFFLFLFIYASQNHAISCVKAQ